VARINWKQAAGEAALILLGILLALAADALWGHRTERIEEREYLIALEDELATLKAYAGDVIRHVSDIEDTGSTLLRISAEWETTRVSTDSLADLVADLGQEIAWSPPFSVYQDLLNTGSVRIIRSEEVRHGLTEVVGVEEWVSDRRERHNQFFWDRLEPYLRRHVSIVAIFEYPGLSAPEATWVPGEFIGSLEFRNIVAAKSFAAADVRTGAEELIQVVDRVLAAVTRERTAL